MQLRIVRDCLARDAVLEAIAVDPAGNVVAIVNGGVDGVVDCGAAAWVAVVAAGQNADRADPVGIEQRDKAFARSVGEHEVVAVQTVVGGIDGKAAARSREIAEIEDRNAGLTEEVLEAYLVNVARQPVGRIGRSKALFQERNAVRERTQQYFIAGLNGGRGLVVP